MTRRIRKSIRDQVRKRARGRCEYCLLHEDDALLPHVPDHIIARRHGGLSELENLAWACCVCNHLKGCDLSSVDLETGRIVRLFNPRHDRWRAHFRLDGAVIVPLSAIGRGTEHFLQLNEEQTLKARTALLKAGRYPRK